MTEVNGIPEDLRWLAENVKGWGGDERFSLVIKDFSHDDYIEPRDVCYFKEHRGIDAYTQEQWQAARKKLGLDQPEVVSEEERIG